MEECYYCEGEFHEEEFCPVQRGDYPLRDWKCACGVTVEVYIWNHGNDVSCHRCDQLFNCYGQRVKGSLGEIDYADAGERWDNE